MRDFFAKLLLAVETLITLPTFIVSWLVCAFVAALIAGFRFAFEADEKRKLAMLSSALGKRDKT